MLRDITVTGKTTLNTLDTLYVDDAKFEGVSTISAGGNLEMIKNSNLKDITGECSGNIFFNYSKIDHPLNFSSCIDMKFSLQNGSTLTIEGSNEIEGIFDGGGVIKTSITNAVKFGTYPTIRGTVNVDAPNGLNVNDGASSYGFVIDGGLSVTSQCAKPVFVTVFMINPYPFGISHTFSSSSKNTYHCHNWNGPIECEEAGAFCNE